MTELVCRHCHIESVAKNIGKCYTAAALGFMIANNIELDGDNWSGLFLADLY